MTDALSERNMIGVYIQVTEDAVGMQLAAQLEAAQSENEALSQQLEQSEASIELAEQNVAAAEQEFDALELQLQSAMQVCAAELAATTQQCRCRHVNKLQVS